MMREPPDAAAATEHDDAADLATLRRRPTQQAETRRRNKHRTVASADPRRWYRERGRLSSHVGPTKQNSERQESGIESVAYAKPHLSGPHG